MRRNHDARVQVLTTEASQRFYVLILFFFDINLVLVVHNVIETCIFQIKNFIFSLSLYEITTLQVTRI